MQEKVFARIQSLQQRQQQLRGESATPAELSPISKAELEEMRHFARPPQTIRAVLEVVFIVLNSEKISKCLESITRGVRLPIEWTTVQTMLKRFETFFPQMQQYDIAPLVAAPDVMQYLSETYFDPTKDDALTQERVYKCNVASAALFQWCGRTVDRVNAAIELLAVDAQLSELASQLPERTRWSCEADSGWVDFPLDIHDQLNKAELIGSNIISFELHWDRYQVNIAAREQTNLLTSRKRPIRPPGDTADLRALQGAWIVTHTCAKDQGSLIAKVQGNSVSLDGRPGELQTTADGKVGWCHAGSEWKISGSPLCVVWSSGSQEIMWSPTVFAERNVDSEADEEAEHKAKEEVEHQANA